MDKLSLQQWRANMAAIRSKDTKQEMIVRMKSAGKGRDEGALRMEAAGKGRDEGGFEDGSRREGTGRGGL